MKRLLVFLSPLLLSPLLLALAGLAPQPARPDLSAEQWREDLRVALDSFLPRDRSFTPETKRRFAAAIAALQRDAPSRTDAQMAVGIARAVALAGNAHTRLHLVRFHTEVRRYPIRVWWFPEGLYVVRTRPEQADLLGARIVRLGGRAPEAVKKEVDTLFAGNAPWSLYMSTYTMTSPDVLAALGIAGRDGTITAELERDGRDGRRVARRLQPLPLYRDDELAESWWDLTPLHPAEDGPWRSLLPADAGRLPLYLRSPDRHYVAERLARERLFYLQYNRSLDMPAGEPFSAFGRRVLAELREKPVDTVVVDLRFNTGGNLDIAVDFFRQLAALTRERKTKLYVVTGRATFSAGLFHAALLRQEGKAVTVGEPVGDLLDFWAEGGNVVLPNSGLLLRYSDGFHSYSRVPRPEFAPWLHTNLEIDGLGPDIPAPLPFADYRAGRDPALAAILARRR